MIVLDTTVLVYAVGADHSFAAPCRRLIEAVRDGALQATTTVEVVQEFAHLRARRRGRKDAAELARAFAETLAPLLIVEESDLVEGLRLFEGGTKIGSFDAVLAASAYAVGCEALISADKAFGELPRIPHVVPDRDGVERLLERA